MSTSDDSFQRILTETVEMALLHVLGEKVISALHFYVDVRTALKNPDNFMSLMSTLIKPRDAENLRETILQELHKKFGKAYKPSSASLTAEIAALKSRTAS